MAGISGFASIVVELAKVPEGGTIFNLDVKLQRVAEEV